MHAIETTGIVEPNGLVRLDETPDLPAGARVKAILMVEDDEISVGDWVQAVSRNPAFDFLKDPSEDIYTLADGVDYHGTQ